MDKEYQICTRCVMDTTDPDIVFDENGYCNHCTNAINQLKTIGFSSEDERKRKLEQIVNKIRKEGEGKEYDCIIGLSGGVDSSYLAYVLVKELGLRPLAVHVDNGWNSELSVMNIERIVETLGIDLDTFVIDWPEFKDLQVAYLKASVVDLEVLSDNAIVVAIYNIAKRKRIKYFISGYNYQTESIMPGTWLYGPKYDGLNIRSIYKKFGNGKKLKKYPLLGLYGYIKFRYFNTINILDFLPYEKSNAIKILREKLAWRDYGGKHCESKITQFYQSYLLPAKFNIDKRKAHLSSLICSNQITREAALLELQKDLYEPNRLKEDKEYFLKKLDLTEKDFDNIMKRPIKSHYDYPSYNKWYKKIKELRRSFRKK